MGSGVLGLGQIGRPDYWRVAVDQFADYPLRGVGAGTYDRTYLLERQTTEDIRQPHSVKLQTLGELGIVGGALLAIFLVAIPWALRGERVRPNDPRARGLAVAAGGTFAVWLVHTSVDWLHLIPGLTGGSHGPRERRIQVLGHPEHPSAGLAPRYGSHGAGSGSARSATSGSTTTPLARTD